MFFTLGAILLSDEDRAYLVPLRGRAGHKADMILMAAEGMPVEQIGAILHRSQREVRSVLDTAREQGVRAAVPATARRGRLPSIDEAAWRWLMSVAARPPSDWGVDAPKWSARVLSAYARAHANAHGHPSVANLSISTANQVLAQVRSGFVEPSRAVPPRAILLVEHGAAAGRLLVSLDLLSGRLRGYPGRVCAEEITTALCADGDVRLYATGSLYAELRSAQLPDGIHLAESRNTLVRATAKLLTSSLTLAGVDERPLDEVLASVEAAFQKG